MKTATKSTLPFYVLMILAMCAWGGAWVSAKIIADMCSPQIIVFGRYLLTAVSMVPILLYRKESFLLSKKSIPPIAFSALFLVAYSIFFFMGLKNGLAGAGGVLLTTINPLFTYVITAALFQKRVTQWEWIGLGVGFLAGVFLLKLWQFSFAELLQSGNFFLLLGALFWSFLAISSSKAQQHCSLFQYSFYLNIFAAIATIGTINFNEISTVFTFSSRFWWNLSYLSFIGTTFGTTAYFLSTNKLGAAKGSSFIFLVPVSATVLSFMILGEKPQLFTIIGGSLAIGAVYIIHHKSPATRQNS